MFFIHSSSIYFMIGWFSTGRDKAARDLLEYAVRKGIEISFVFCNREKGESEESDKFIDLVESYGFDLICFSSKKFLPELRKKNKKEWRTLYDEEILKLIPHKDLNVLAGYMLILSPLACDTLNMINLHPALPDGPKGTWQEVIWELIRSNAKETGAMMHLVTKDLDRGPVVTYCRFSIDYPDLREDFENLLKFRSFEEIKKEGHPLFYKIREEELKREFPLIGYTIKAFENKEIEIKNKKIYSHGKEIRGYDISERVEREVKMLSQ